MSGPPSIRCVLATNEYGTYAIPDSCVERPAAKAVIEGAIWEPETIRYMVANHAGRDIVHAGTFFGDFLPPLSRSLSPGALLWAFEPHPESYLCARWTIQLNGLTNCRLINAGLGSSAERKMLYTHGPKGQALGGASSFINRSGGTKGVHCDLVRLDDVVAGRAVGIVQLDVEDFEEAALTGALDTIARQRPIIILEHPPSDQWWAAHLAPLGYVFFGRVNHNSIFRPTE